MPVIQQDAVLDSYDLVIAGTGFGAMFFLQGYLARFPNARVLLVEWGSYRTHAWQLSNQRNSDIECEDTYVRSKKEKPWFFTIGYGGGTNCWWAHTPRLTPNDFKLKSTFGVGTDWPLSYDDLEPYYLEAERIMHVAGPEESASVYPRSAPYPQPPHNVSSVDKLMMNATPESHFSVPCARLRVPVGNRNACCDSVACNLCPVEAKFTVLNTFDVLITKPNVHVLPNARVLSVDTQGGRARGLTYETNSREYTIPADLVAVGCNAIHTPYILMRSGLKHKALGRYLHEKHVITFEVLLDGVENFDGGIPTSGFNTQWVDGDHRRDAAGAMVYFINHYYRDGLRDTWGRWRQTLPIEIFVEDIPQKDNRVVDIGRDKPFVTHANRSDYCKKGIARALDKLPELLAPLPVEKIIRRNDLPTGFHIQGTCRMGDDPKTSIVDASLVHHEIRNLLVLGTAVWPSCGTANPSLTAAALSLRAADKLSG